MGQGRSLVTMAGHSAEFSALLAACVAPLVLVSSVGLILLSLTHRLGRTADLARQIIDEIEERGRTPLRLTQLEIVYKRCRILRASIVSIAASIFLSSLLVLTVTIMSATDWDLGALGFALLVGSVLGIVAGSFFLLRDILLTLRALKLEVDPHLLERK